MTRLCTRVHERDLEERKRSSPLNYGVCYCRSPSLPYVALRCSWRIYVTCKFKYAGCAIEGNVEECRNRGLGMRSWYMCSSKTHDNVTPTSGNFALMGRCFVEPNRYANVDPPTYLSNITLEIFHRQQFFFRVLLQQTVKSH